MKYNKCYLLCGRSQVLISGKLTTSDCRPLVNKPCDRIETWMSQFLAYAGRLQLIKSVLSSIKGYWSLYLFLTVNVLKAAQSIFSKFLWGGTKDRKCQYKVAWTECCLLKQEGGLGIRNMSERNTAAILH